MVVPVWLATALHHMAIQAWTSVRLRLDMVMDIVQALATTTEAPRDKDMAMEAITRGLLNLVMDTVESATITEAPKVSKAMDITRGLQLLSLDMALLMSMLSRRIMDM